MPEGHKHERRQRARRIPTRCIVCGYSLASLADDALCPECGSSVWHSRHGTLLTMRHAPYLRSVRRGARMLAIGLWIAFVTGAVLELSLSYRYPRDTAWPLNPRSVASLTDDVPLFKVEDERIYVTAAGLGATIRRESDARSIIVRVEQDGSVRSDGATTSPPPRSAPGYLRIVLCHALGLGEPLRDYAETGPDRIELLRDHDVGLHLTDGMGSVRLIRVDRDGRA